MIFAGAVRIPLFDAALAHRRSPGEVAPALGAAQVVGAHTDSWGHVSETREQLEAAFSVVGLGDRLQRD